MGHRSIPEHIHTIIQTYRHVFLWWEETSEPRGSPHGRIVTHDEQLTSHISSNNVLNPNVLLLLTLPPNVSLPRQQQIRNAVHGAVSLLKISYKHLKWGEMLTQKRCGWIWLRIWEMFDKQEDYSLAYSGMGRGWMHIILYYIIFLHIDPTKSTFKPHRHAISSLLLFVNQEGCRLISFCSLIKQHKNKILPFSAHMILKHGLPEATCCINPA